MVSHDNKIYYIRLFDNMLNSPEMNEIRTLPDGHKIVSFFISLLMYLKGSKTGVLEEVIAGTPLPISADKLRLELRYWNALEVETALRVLNRYGFISINNQMAFVVNNYIDIGGAETKEASIMRRLRKSKADRKEIGTTETTFKTTNKVTNNVTNNVSENADSEKTLSLESEKKVTNNVTNNVSAIVLDSMSVVQEINQNNNSDSLPPFENKGNEPRTKEEFYKVIINLYNETCTKLPKLEMPDSNHHQLIDALILDGVKVEEFKKVFSKVADNEFFNGKFSSRGWRANFGWILNPTHFKRILNGEYDKWSKGVRLGISSRFSEIDKDLVYYAENYGRLKINPLEVNVYDDVSDEEYFTAIKALPLIVVEEITKQMDKSSRFAKLDEERFKKRKDIDSYDSRTS